MSRAVNAIVIGVAVFVLLAGSIWYVMVAREPSRIKTSTEREWEGAAGNRFVATVTFENPYDYEVVFHRYDYKFLVNGDEWGGGGDAPEQVMKPHTKTRIPISVNISVQGISGWFKTHVANHEESTVQLRGEATFSFSDRNQTVPFGYRETFSTNILESIVEADRCNRAQEVCFAGGSARWVEKDKAVVLQLDATLHNPTGDRADLGNSTFAIVWNGVEVAKAETSGGFIDADQEVDAEFLVFFEHARLVQWWARHTASCEESEAQAVLALEVRYESPEDPDEDPSSSPTPARTSSTSKPSNTTSPSPTSSSPSPTTSSSPPPTNTTGSTEFRFARAEPGAKATFELSPIRTKFVCRPG